MAAKQDSELATILTVGHGTRSIEEFLALLVDEDVGRLVDVRVAPASRRNPQFGRDAVAAALSEAGVEYVWRKDLGGFREPLPETRHAALRAKPFQGYADYMDTDEFREALAWLIRTSREVRTAIMCAESLWWRCHRRMIADALLASGLEVRHLMDRGRQAPHELHPAGRVEGGKPVYDVGSQPSLAL